jgi:hypothetical protein
VAHPVICADYQAIVVRRVATDVKRVGEEPKNRWNIIEVFIREVGRDRKLKNL